MKSKIFIFYILFIHFQWVVPQNIMIRGQITDGQSPIPNAHLVHRHSGVIYTGNSVGEFTIPFKSNEKAEYLISALGFKSKMHLFSSLDTIFLEIILETDVKNIPEVEILSKAYDKRENTINSEVFSMKNLSAVPSSGLFESLRQLNGVRPQITCNVCQAGEIQINGMSGPYTLVLIDGMPIVSALASVYGLTSIPNDIVEKIEITKGPGSAQFGSDAMGGTIHIITKQVSNSPKISVKSQISSYGEWTNDLAFKFQQKKFNALIGANYFRANSIWDNNQDGFTDIPLQNRYSFFSKLQLTRPSFRQAGVVLRLMDESRWGGQTNWSHQFRGTDSIYGEYIKTQRLELLANYQLPLNFPLFTQFSYNYHYQNSYYGTTHLFANQHNIFGQLYTHVPIKQKNQLSAGLTVRYTLYDDNTVATQSSDSLKSQSVPQVTFLPGLYVQNEWTPNKNHSVIAGIRMDYHVNHGFIPSPRIHYKYNLGNSHILKFGYGRGFRIVNLFTEDHAALSGSRTIVIQSNLKPESSHNLSLNYLTSFVLRNSFINLDVGIFYNYFNNRIIGDFDSNPNLIIFNNLNGYGTSRGVSLGVDMEFAKEYELTVGGTYNDVFVVNNQIKTQQIYAPAWSGVIGLKKNFSKIKLSLAMNGNITGPMRLPVLPNDFRPEYSPTYMLLNMSITKVFFKSWEFTLAGRNLLNYIPQYALIRANDPFDKKANDPLNNPFGYTFDTTYNYAPLQGIQIIFGVKFSL